LKLDSIGFEKPIFNLEPESLNANAPYSYHYIDLFPFYIKKTGFSNT